MPYLPNLATPDRTLMKRSRSSLKDEVQRCDLLEVDYVVAHLGSHLGNGTMTGVRNVAGACNEALKESTGQATILLENTAGQKNTVGARFEELRMILDLVERRDRVGVCLDTCLPPGSPVMINEMPLPVERARPGDTVIGADGTATRVLALLKRRYSGNLVCIKPIGIPPIRTTPEHPFLYVGVTGVKQLEASSWRVKLLDSPRWVNAKDARPGDYLVMPKMRGAPVTSLDFARYKGAMTRCSTIDSSIPLTPEVAEFLGLYLAEGFSYMGRDEHGEHGKVYFAYDYEEKDLIRRTERLAADLFGLGSWIDEQETALRVCIGSNILTRFLRNNFGLSASEKRIPPFMLHAPKDCIPAFVRAYLRGDGCVDESGLRFTTSSDYIPCQLIHLLAEIDVHAVLNEHGPHTTMIGERLVESEGWNEVRVGQAEANKLGYAFSLPTASQRTILRDSANFYLPIRAVRSERYEGPVYNLTTEDGSFVAPYVVTHNCHAFAAGFDLSSKAGVERTISLFDELVGLDELKVVHLNDSKGVLGSGLDRHEHIGRGRIGRVGLRAFLHHERIAELPLIMETPLDNPATLKANLALARTLAA